MYDFFCNAVFNDFLESVALVKLSAIHEIIGLRDPYTQAHTRRVAVYAKQLARRMGLDGQQVDAIELGGMLHDIGKIGLSNRVFGPEDASLSEALQAELRLHPTLGFCMLKGMGFFHPVPDYVHLHHERIDGTGYPFGLTGAQIPLGAQIIGIADSFDAMTTDRPYQRSKSRRDACEILLAQSGLGFDSEVVSCFCGAFAELREVA